MNWQNLLTPQNIVKTLRSPLDNRLTTLLLGGVLLGVALIALLIRGAV